MKNGLRHVLCRKKSATGSSRRAPELLKRLALNGGLEKTRTSDLFRVKENRSITYEHPSRVFSNLRNTKVDAIWTPEPVVPPFGLRADSGRAYRLHIDYTGLSEGLAPKECARLNYAALLRLLISTSLAARFFAFASLS